MNKTKSKLILMINSNCILKRENLLKRKTLICETSKEWFKFFERICIATISILE